MYQIFPDRFNEGHPGKTMPFADRIYREDKTGEPYFWPNEQADGYLNRDYFGGDFEGIRQKLPYLKNLGVTCIYLNPIFEAHSSTTGTTRRTTASPTRCWARTEDFALLCREPPKSAASACMLDGVFSHTGCDCVYFNRAGPLRPHWRAPTSDQEAAATAPGTSFDSGWPCGYRSWWGFETLPEVQRGPTPGTTEFVCGEGRRQCDTLAAPGRLRLAAGCGGRTAGRLPRPVRRSRASPARPEALAARRRGVGGRLHQGEPIGQPPAPTCGVTAAGQRDELPLPGGDPVPPTLGGGADVAVVAEAAAITIAEHYPKPAHRLPDEPPRHARHRARS